MSKLSTNEYRLRDYRTRCQKCRRWMRHKPTVSSPAKRAHIPRADLCVDCWLTIVDVPMANSAQLRARAWLIRNDPDPDKFWEHQPLGTNFVENVEQNLRDFGPDKAGKDIVSMYKKAVRR